MRNLTIKRIKSFVGCLGKMKIYIEDPASSEILINQIPCRKLGVLKNGEEKTFAISNEAARVFVIADKLSKEYCNEYYQLPEGEEDISLSGKNKFNPANGNAFRFDNNESEGIAAHRKKGVRKGLGFLIGGLIVGIIAGLVIGFISALPEEKNFYAKGMTITLTDKFECVNNADYIAVFDSSTAAVFVSREEIRNTTSLYSQKDYANIIASSNGHIAEIQSEDGLTWFEYDDVSDKNGVTYHFTVYVFKTKTMYWVVTFATTKKYAKNFEDEIKEWAESIEFAQ